MSSRFPHEQIVSCMSFEHLDEAGRQLMMMHQIDAYRMFRGSEWRAVEDPRERSAIEPTSQGLWWEGAFLGLARMPNGMDVADNLVFRARQRRIRGVSTMSEGSPVVFGTFYHVILGGFRGAYDSMNWTWHSAMNTETLAERMPTQSPYIGVLLSLLVSTEDEAARLPALAAQSSRPARHLSIVRNNT